MLTESGRQADGSGIVSSERGYQVIVDGRRDENGVKLYREQVKSVKGV